LISELEPFAIEINCQVIPKIQDILVGATHKIDELVKFDRRFVGTGSGLPTGIIDCWMVNIQHKLSW